MTRGARLAGAVALVGFGAVALAGSRGVLWQRPPAAPHRAAKTTLASPPARPFLMFVGAAPDDAFKRVVLAPLAAPDGPRYITPLTCERVYFAGARGLCLATESDGPGVGTTVAYVFDETFARLHRIVLAGPPSRTRLSPDGARAAFTVFDEGHSYADGVFSTRTTIVDTATGADLGDLEKYTVLADGQPLARPDFNFWGVTFAKDGNRFFATLRTQGRAFMIEARVDTRVARVVASDAECPSISPDNTRIVFKQQLAGRRGWWQLSLLDLASGAIRVLPGETHSVDDQVEWLDDSHLLYFRPTEEGNIIWRAAAEWNEPPQPFVHDGFSPAVVR